MTHVEQDIRVVGGTETVSVRKDKDVGIVSPFLVGIRVVIGLVEHGGVFDLPM